MALRSLSITTSLKFAVMPIMKVLAMCGLGYILATKRVGLLTPARIKFLNQLVFMVFLPSLIFTQLGSAITLQKMIQCAVKPPPQFRKFTIIAIGIGNIGNIPLVLMDALCRDSSNPFGTYETCSTKGVAYISYGQWVGAVIVYTFVYHMLSPPEELGDCITSQLNRHNSVTVQLLDNKEATKDDIHEGKSLIQRFSAVGRKFTQAWEALNVTGMLKQIFQPPVTASILALVIGAIPFLKNLVVAEDGPLYFLTDSLSIMGDAMIPGIMLTLGGNLVGGPGSSELGLRTTVAIVLVRLFLIPFVGAGIVFLAKKLGLLVVGDELFEFVLLLQHSMPSSVLAGSVAALRGVAVKEAAAILFYEHIVAIFSISLCLQAGLVNIFLVPSGYFVVETLVICLK
ncbi:hypothetical protein GOP47_0012220 [Adiantum capillus-veneris]|uniref:Uncharacterized protein n=1 Tax=Adiantum capillus-veneris TaxID=13818 RepID=A0A9D4ZE91_ADICA|nr:hypothetical protein GOP47_0012220 [Adiantum capillus-veneris]